MSPSAFLSVESKLDADIENKEAAKHVIFEGNQFYCFQARPVLKNQQLGGG